MVIAPVLPGSLRCPRCATPTVPAARFCFQCGQPLEVTTGRAGPDEGTERRVVTVLFGDLSDFTAWAEDLDPERVGEVTDRVLAALARVVDDVGGRVDNLTGDGIMAVFGAPTAHEDDPERAVRAAATMQDTMRRLVADEAGGGRRLGLRVGINSGEVLAGVQASLSYTVIGDTVNTAARLSDAAGIGTIYAGRDTAHATTSVATWRPLPPLRLKGKRDPVHAYELVSLRPSNVARPGLGDETPFTGRDGELGIMTGRLREVVRRGTPGTLVVTGEAGIGKTRTARELGRHARGLPSARVLWGRTARYADGGDLAPLVDIVRKACGIEEGDDPAKAAGRVRRTTMRLDGPGRPEARLDGSGDVARLPPATADRLLALLGLPANPVGLDALVEHGGGDRVDVIIDGVAGLLRALAAEGPLLVILDDLEWAGPPMWEALRRLAAGLTGPTLLVLLDREAPDLTDLPDPELLELTPLEDDAAARLLRDYLGGAELDSSTRSDLVGRVRGNPFFLTELLHLLVDRGVLRRRSEGRGTPAARSETPAWVLEGSLPGDALPAGVQAVLAARIDSLDALSKATLRTAAVLGERFPADALATVEGRSPAIVAATLDTLAERQLVRPPGPEDLLWSFVHPMARDVAYAGLPKADRARRHAAATRWALSSMTGSPGEVDGFAGTHAERATELATSMALPDTDPAWSVRDAGFHALVRLAQAAVARDEHRAADGLLVRARRLRNLAVPGQDELFAQVLHAEALASLRRLDEALTTLSPALAVTDPRLRAAAYGVLGDIRHKQGRDDEAAEALRTALEQADLAEDERVTVATLRQLGMLEYAAGRLHAAEVHYRDALDLARRCDDARGAGWALQHLAWSATTRGDYPVAEHALTDARDVFTRLDDAGGLGWCAGTQTLVWTLSGRLRRAREVAGELIETAQATGEQWGLAVCLTIDAVAAAELGDVTRADAEATRAAEAFAAVGDTWGSALTLIARGLAARGAGFPDRGGAFLRDACRAATSGRHALVSALSLVLLGLTRLDAGRVDDAEAAAGRALRALERLDLEPHALLGARVLVAQVERARGRTGRAIDVLDEALEASEPATLLFPRRQAYAHLAGTLLDAGQYGRALVVARQAVAVDAEDVRAQVLAWRALGSALAANGDVPGAREAYERALTEATATGAVSEAPQTRRLLAALPVAS